MRQAAPWSRKMSATSRAGRATSAGALCGRLVWLQPARREPIERAHDHGDGVGGAPRVERRGLELGVPEQHLDHADVNVLLQQVSREAVAQRVRRDPLSHPPSPALEVLFGRVHEAVLKLASAPEGHATLRNIGLVIGRVLDLLEEEKAILAAADLLYHAVDEVVSLR